jgi:hypothetical protein
MILIAAAKINTQNAAKKPLYLLKIQDIVMKMPLNMNMHRITIISGGIAV